MSTNLELRPELLGVVRRPPVKLQIPRPSMADGGAIRKERNESAEECCRTPTSAENKIPEVLQCPPAPRKRKRAPSCRRRLMEIDEFVEILNREEIEPYLTASLELEDRVKSAKRCFCECK